jgi:hypothetical protein
VLAQHLLGREVPLPVLEHAITSLCRGSMRFLIHRYSIMR